MKTKWAVYLIIMLVITSFYSGCSFLPYGNTAPVLGSTPPTTAKVEYLYTYNVNTNDLEDDFLIYSLLTSPEGMTIDSSTGVITWTPTKEQIGGNEVTVKVNDKWRWDAQAFLVTVSEIVLTSIEVIPSTMSLAEEDSNVINLIYLIVTANYDYGPSKTIALRNCTYESSNTNIATVGHTGVISGIFNGSATITVSYTEGEVTKSDTIDVTVFFNPVCDT
ncbi:hypothetical protein ES708_21317 [subsurface metagenome]